MKKPLSSSHPEVVQEWHPTKNGGLTPNEVSGGSHLKIWWKCPKGTDHEWQATVKSRTGSNRNGCPYCRGFKVSMTNSLAALFPKVAAEWHPTKNSGRTPEQIV